MIQPQTLDDLGRFLALAKAGRRVNALPSEQAARRLAQALVHSWNDLDRSARRGAIDFAYEVARVPDAAALAAGVWAADWR